MIILKEIAGDTLTGTIDGSNKVFVVSFDFIPDTVNVYVNGLRKEPSLDDGYTVTSPKTITLKLAPISGDTVEVEYQSAVVKTGGGAFGGCPSPPKIRDLTAEAAAKELLPGGPC